MTMTESPQNLRTLFKSAKAKREALERVVEAGSASYQENLISAVSAFEDCQRLVAELGLFSSNETADDISSGDLQ